MNSRLDKLWWVDYVESELTSEDLRQVEMILKNSETDQLIVDNLSRLRRLLKNNDVIDAPVKPEYYQDLCSRIMNQIDAIEPETTERNVIPLTDDLKR